MFQEAFEKLDLAEVATILDRLQPALEGAPFDPVETTILSWDTPFYKGYRLLDIADNTVMPAIKRYVVYGPKNFVLLNSTNKPIYQLNQDAPLKLNDETVADYARFFFNFVRGKHGRFMIAENVDDIPWKEDPPPSARKAIAKMVTPVAIITSGKDDYKLEACMIFKDALFKCDINVKKNGQVALNNEQLLVDDMPVFDSTLNH